jgi:hypothetical protein
LKKAIKFFTEMKLLRILFLCAAMITVFTGCTTTQEPENASDRPWNGQRGWEHGLPAGINQGR